MERNPALFNNQELGERRNGKPEEKPIRWDDDTIPGFPFKVADVSGAAQRMVVYKNADLSIELSIRIAYSEYDLGEELLCWNGLSSAGDPASSTAAHVDIGIYSHRNYIVTVIQKSVRDASPEVTRTAALTVLRRVAGKQAALI
ncbi:hypothetical protein [Cohnella sp. AR92]|uniref:hypothetical protein n=1 Tax=Cohnella sp. AR92 TaxID=648716 RepID=UPI000F8CF360|nr:hypothetical protein [Cohnella sp. AR92]RUS45751.1 hypothetical protein ELR57_17985 [Cohnella sp. AR92]